MTRFCIYPAFINATAASDSCPSRPSGHVPMRAKIDSSVWCIRCGAYLGEAN